MQSSRPGYDQKISGGKSLNESVIAEELPCLKDSARPVVLHDAYLTLVIREQFAKHIWQANYSKFEQPSITDFYSLAREFNFRLKPPTNIAGPYTSLGRRPVSPVNQRLHL